MNYLASIQLAQFPEKGLGRDKIAELHQARNVLVHLKLWLMKAIPPMIMQSQLHSVFSTHTLIERELSTLISSGIIRKLVLRGSSSEGKGGEVTGVGGEFGLILSSNYMNLLSFHPNLVEFSKWVQDQGRNIVRISHSDLISQVHEDEIKKAVELGFLTMDYSLRETGYTISVPGIGNFVKNLRGGRTQLLRSLKRERYKEMLEKVVF
jgi:Serine-threonine protein kinase 19